MKKQSGKGSHRLAASCDLFSAILEQLDRAGIVQDARRGPRISCEIRGHQIATLVDAEKFELSFSAAAALCGAPLESQLEVSVED